MRLRNTAILLVILVVLLGYTYYIQTRTPGGPAAANVTPAPTPITMYDFLTNNVTRFEVTDLVKNQTVAVTRQGDAWHMEQPKDSPTDALKIESAVGNLAHLDASRILTQTTDLAAYGLITGTLEARVTLNDNTQHVLKFGNDAPSTTQTYVLKDNDKSNVYLVENSITQVLRDFVSEPPYPPTPTLTPLPTLTPSVTPTPGTPTPEATPSP